MRGWAADAAKLSMRHRSGLRLEPVQRTALHQRHQEAGATWMDAGMWRRPRAYSTAVEESRAVREGVGIIDVSTLGKLDLQGRDAARLYFRAPDGKGFLVRDVPLGSGLDALGRESIAQVVEASLVSLLHSGAGLSRAAFERELGSEPTSATPREAESAVPNAPSNPTSSVEQEQADPSRSNPGAASRSRFRRAGPLPRTTEG